MKKEFWAIGRCRKKDGWILSIYKKTEEQQDTIKVKKI